LFRMLFALLVAISGWCSADDLRQPAPNVHALSGMDIVTEPGQRIEAGTVVIRDGIIEAVGQHVSIPPDARLYTWERKPDEPRMTVYAGLIEPFLAIATDDGEDSESKQATAGRHDLIHPDQILGAGHWPEDRLPGLRSAGFTTALLAPAEGLLRGSGALVNLGHGGLSGNLLADRFGQFAGLAGRVEGRNFPNSLMGAVALVRQSFSDARWQRQARQAWQSNPAQARPQWLEGLEPLSAVWSGTTPLFFQSTDTLDSLRILGLIDDPDVSLIVIGHGREYQRMQALAERAVPHILPLDFPDSPEVKDEQDRNVALEELRHWQRAPDNPRMLLEAGIPIALTSHGQSSPNDLFEALAKAIDRGLDPDQALAALTTRPAQWLGIADRAGRIEPGYMANLIVVEDDLLVAKPKISELWIDGLRYPLASVEPPSVDPAGSWSLTLGLGTMGDVEANMQLSGPPTAMTGSLSVMGNDNAFSSVRVSGKKVVASLDSSRFGGSGTITLRLDIDGDRARGTGSGPFGEFKINGRRNAGPDQTQEVRQ